MVTITDFGHWSATKSERWLHAHRNPGLELVYVANGKIDWDYDGKRVPVAPGEVSFSWPWETHGAVDARLPSVELYWVLIPLAKAYTQPQRRARYHPSLRMDPDEERRSVAQLQSIEHPVVSASPLLRLAFPALIDELQVHGMADPMRIRALILLLLSEVTRTAGLPEAEPDDEAATRVGAFVASLEQCCDEAWSLDSMARACGLGRSRFALLFKAVCGDSPIQYLNRVRVARARSMLRTSSATITEIAFACGFSSSQYFSTVFRQFYGEAPREVRRP